jgi:hypothetical protein
MNTAALNALIAANPEADAAALLAMAQADPRTVTAIPLTGKGLLAYMTQTGLLTRLQRSADAIASQDQTGADVLKSFCAYVTAGNATFDTQDADYATMADQLFIAMVGLHGQVPTLGVSSDEQAAIITMGGGYLLKDATLDDVTAALAKRAREAAALALSALIDAPFFAANDLRNARVTTLGAILAAGGEIPADLAALDAMGAG